MLLLLWCTVGVTAVPAPPGRVYADCVGSSTVSAAVRNKLVPGYWGPSLAPYTSFILLEGDTLFFHPSFASTDDDDGSAAGSAARLRVYQFDPKSKLSAARWAGCFHYGGAELPPPTKIKEREGDEVLLFEK